MDYNANVGVSAANIINEMAPLSLEKQSYKSWPWSYTSVFCTPTSQGLESESLLNNVLTSWVCRLQHTTKNLTILLPIQPMFIVKEKVIAPILYFLIQRPSTVVKQLLNFGFVVTLNLQLFIHLQVLQKKTSLSSCRIEFKIMVPIK